MKILAASFETSCTRESRIVVSDMQKTRVVATRVYPLNVSRSRSTTLLERREYLSVEERCSISCIARMLKLTTCKDCYDKAITYMQNYCRTAINFIVRYLVLYLH